MDAFRASFELALVPPDQTSSTWCQGLPGLIIRRGATDLESEHSHSPPCRWHFVEVKAVHPCQYIKGDTKDP